MRQRRFSWARRTATELLEESALSRLLFGREQDETETGLTRAGCPTAAMDVGVGRTGQLEVDDVLNAGDIETTSGDVGGEHDAGR